MNKDESSRRTLYVLVRPSRRAKPFLVGARYVDHVGCAAWINKHFGRRFKAFSASPMRGVTFSYVIVATREDALPRVACTTWPAFVKLHRLFVAAPAASPPSSLPGIGICGRTGWNTCGAWPSSSSSRTTHSKGASHMMCGRVYRPGKGFALYCLRDGTKPQWYSWPDPFKPPVGLETTRCPFATAPAAATAQRCPV